MTKIPRFAFEKFDQANPVLTTQMKSVGEVMAIGRTFQESLQKALRGLEVNSAGFESFVSHNSDANILYNRLAQATPERIWYIGDAFRSGMGRKEIFELTSIDPWFLAQIEDIIDEDVLYEENK